jgi:ferritin-like metal-binding protein YciE
LLAAAQAVEHYEISRYGTLKSWAGKLGMKDAGRLLDQTLAEEKKTDETPDKDRRHGGQCPSSVKE